MSESGSEPLDRLQRALDVWLDYSARRGARDSTEDRESFLASQEPELRPLLEDFFDQEGLDAEGETESPRIIGGFRLVGELGRGGMGVVHEAIETKLERRVALKVLDPGIALSAAGLERFRREAAAAARLRHPGIAQLYGVGKDAGVHWLSMELVEGESLADKIRAAKSGKSRITASEAAEWTAQVAEALEFAHDASILHRDLKPQNILIDLDANARLIDFGLAKFLDRSHVTLTAGFAGSLAYASPEQTQGSRDLDARTDIWSIGVVLYELLALERPFGGSSTETLMQAITSADPPRPAGPNDLITICLKCLEKDPTRRYVDAASLAADLRRFLRHEEIEAVPPSTVSRFLRLVRRRRTPILAGCALVALAAVSISYGIYRKSATQTVNDVVSGAEQSLRRLVKLSDQVKKEIGPVAPFREQLEANVREAERLLALRPKEDELQNLVAEAHLRAASIYQELKLAEPAFRSHDRVHDLCTEVIQRSPADFVARNILATSNHNRHIYERALGKHEQSNAHLELAISAWERLLGSVERLDRIATVRAGLANALTNRAEYHSQIAGVDSIDEVMAELDRASGIWKKVIADPNCVVGHYVKSLRTEGLIGTLAARAGNLDEATHKLGTITDWIRAFPEHILRRAVVQTQLARILGQRGNAFRMIKKWKEAEACYREQIAIYTKLAETGSRDGEISLLGSEFALVALFDESDNDSAEVETILVRAEARAERLMKVASEIAAVPKTRARIATIRAYRDWSAKKAPNTVRESFGRALELSTRLLDDPLTKSRDMVISHAQLAGSFGSWLARNGSAEEAIAQLEPAMTTVETILETEPKNTVLQQNLIVQARAYAIALMRKKSIPQLVEVAARLRSASPDNPNAVGLALATLDQATLRFTGPGRQANGEKMAMLCIEWIRDADERKVPWRKTTWLKAIKALNRHPKVKAAIAEAGQ